MEFWLGGRRGPMLAPTVVDGLIGASRNPL